MGKISKEEKINFAVAFAETGNGFRALEYAGLPRDYDILFKLTTDKQIEKFIDKYAELVELAKGRTREAHIAKLEEMFDEVAEAPESEKKNYHAAARLSERIEKLKGWDKTGANNMIEIDLQLGADKPIMEHEETQEEQEEKVLNHFRKDGLL